MTEREQKKHLIKAFSRYVIGKNLGRVSIIGDYNIKYISGRGMPDVCFCLKNNRIYVELWLSQKERAIANYLQHAILEDRCKMVRTEIEEYTVFTLNNARDISKSESYIREYHLTWMLERAEEIKRLYKMANLKVSEYQEKLRMKEAEDKDYLLNPKSIIGMALLLWDICNYVGYPIECHEIKDGEYYPKIKYIQRILAKAKSLNVELPGYTVCLERFLSNELFKYGAEIVQLTLDDFWGIAQVRYSTAESAERYRPFSLVFKSYSLIIKELLTEYREEYFVLLLSWSGLLESDSMDDNFNRLNNRLIKILTISLDSSFISLKDDFKFKFVQVITSSLQGDDRNRLSYIPETEIAFKILNSNTISAKLARALLKQGLHYYLGDFKGSRISRKEDIELYEYKSYARLVTTIREGDLRAVSFEREQDNQAYEEKITFETDASVNRITGAQNILLYGAPGVGKSYAISSEYCSDEEKMIRVVFHPEYSHADFVGQIQPVLEDGSVVYKFIPGPFTDSIKLALLNPSSYYYLVIEELNRGQAPAIFGEMFQLLDRRDDTEGNRLAGESLYGVTSRQIAEYLFGDPMKKIRIPSNLNVIATMNTSDQNVFTLDTAFQRRWNMRYIENDFTSVPHKDSPILGSDVTWMHFAKTINDVIVSSNSGVAVSEDKRLGRYFVRPQDLACVNEEHMEKVDEAMLQRPVNMCFAEKVVKYLWDDAFRYSRADLFDLDNVNTLDEAIAKFNGSSGNDRFRIFNSTVYDELVRSESK